MGLPENDFQILRLTESFYARYTNPPYVEVLEKESRAYNCILFQTHYNYFICVPYRTEISHKYAYHFKTSVRSKVHRSGLDYTKIIIVSNIEYIDNKDAIVDKDEYNETIANITRIKREALKFVEDYVTHIKGTKVMHYREFYRRYNFSTLKYFHKEFGV